MEYEDQNVEIERSIPIHWRARQVDDKVDVLAARVDETDHGEVSADESSNVQCSKVGRPPPLSKCRRRRRPPPSPPPPPPPLSDRTCSDQLFEEFPSVLISSGLLVQADEGTLLLVVDLIRRITDSACKNQSVVVSVQYRPFNPYIPIRSTTIGKSRVAIDPIAMHTSWRSNNDIASVTRKVRLEDLMITASVNTQSPSLAQDELIAISNQQADAAAEYKEIQQMEEFSRSVVGLFPAAGLFRGNQQTCTQISRWLQYSLDPVAASLNRCNQPIHYKRDIFQAISWCIFPGVESNQPLHIFQRNQKILKSHSIVFIVTSFESVTNVLLKAVRKISFTCKTSSCVCVLDCGVARSSPGARLDDRVFVEGLHASNLLVKPS
ncbi:purple acid phosphatase 22-like [Dorcoceras hygrometricum]|uniref:Purple acid phosphatase 22-like n=1 Tax=Dorcoceras hygrometricum TaxID=472368 RepID=A0A2Z7BED8_9LAMI|nr:purple acid phosphatase 22-like [Dorcoceras hygrometricum]